MVGGKYGDGRVRRGPPVEDQDEAKPRKVISLPQLPGIYGGAKVEFIEERGLRIDGRMQPRRMKK